MIPNSIFSSVIICTYNRSGLLQRLLQALAKQTVPAESFEIIIVDDGSTDATAAVCLAMQKELPQLKYIAIAKNSGLSHAANQAVAAARGDYLLFTDDDCIPQPQWLAQMCASLAHEPIVAGTVLSPTAPYFKLCHNIAQFYPFMPGQKSVYVDFIAGANMGFRASVFRDIGPFNPHTIITDMEFILRARRYGYKIVYAPLACVVHDPQRVHFTTVLSYAARHARVTIQLRLLFRDVLDTPALLGSPLAITLSAPLIALKTTASIYWKNRKLLGYAHTIPMVYLIKLAWCWGAVAGLLEKKRNNTDKTP